MLRLSTFLKFFTAFLFTLSLFAFYSFYVSITTEDPDKLEAQEFSGSMDLNIPVSHPEIPFNLSGSDTFLLPANPGPADNGGSANWAMFFNLVANTRNVYVTKMRTASTAGASVSYSVEVFTRTGTALGGPVGSGPGSSTAGWTSLGTVPVVQGPTANGISEVFYLPPILVPANETVGVALRFTGAGPRYFGQGSPPHGNYNDTNITLITGEGRSIPFTPTGSWFSSRELTGEIWYYVEQPPPPFGPESEMSLVHTPGNLNFGAYNTGNIGKQSITPFGGPGILWNGVDGCFTGGGIWGRQSVGSVNGNIGSFTGHNDLRNVASNFAGGFTSDANFNQITTAIITDSAAPTSYGINVIQKTYSNTSEEFVFVRYGFINSTGSTISDLYSGIFVDWDINEATYTTNSGGYAPDRNMVYNFNVGAVQPYFGIGALDGPSGWRTSTATPTPTVRQGSFNWITTLDQTTTFPPGDYRTWVGQSVPDMSPGDTSWVTYAFVGGTDLISIRQYMADAHQKAFNLGWITTLGINPVSNEIPTVYKLEQNYPNPFNPVTYINFSIPEQGMVTLKIYDLLGKEVTTLVNEVTNAGTYSVPFDASKLSSGVYYYRIESGSFVDSKKMMLIK